MKALQQMGIYGTLEAAQEHFVAMSKQDGFLGGRVYDFYNQFTCQVFFECDQSLEYGELYYGSPERVVLIMDSQKAAIGIGNPYSRIYQPATERVQPENNPETATVDNTTDETDELLAEWLDIAETTRQAFLRRDMKEFYRLVPISHQAQQKWAKALEAVVYAYKK